MRPVIPYGTRSTPTWVLQALRGIPTIHVTQAGANVLLIRSRETCSDEFQVLTAMRIGEDEAEAIAAGVAVGLVSRVLRRLRDEGLVVQYGASKRNYRYSVRSRGGLLDLWAATVRRNPSPPAAGSQVGAIRMQGAELTALDSIGVSLTGDTLDQGGTLTVELRGGRPSARNPP